MSESLRFHVVIPARYASTRLPGKALRVLAGEPMIRHVVARAQESGAETVVVATDDARIRDAVAARGTTVCMTSAQHASGTDRLAEAVSQLGWGEHEIVVNLQGDEPLMPPSLLREVATALHEDTQAQAATLCAPVQAAAQLFDPNVVKVVRDAEGRALYFSRAPIPWARDAFAAGDARAPLPAGGPYFRHLGLYAYRVGLLRHYSALEPSPLETLECLEQLRLLWHGLPVRVNVTAEHPSHGVDTEADLQRVAAVLASKGTVSK